MRNSDVMSDVKKSSFTFLTPANRWPAVDVGNCVVLIFFGSTTMNDDFLDNTHIVIIKHVKR